MIYLYRKFGLSILQKKTPIPPRLLYVLAVVTGIILIWLGTQNRPDPTWAEAVDIVRQPCPMLEDVVDSTSLYYSELHHRSKYLPSGTLDSTGFKILASPYLRTLSWYRIRNFCREAEKRKFIVLAGVTGTGTTKLAEKAASFMATDPVKNIITIKCSPEFDLELHKKYIGREDEKNQFHPGLLLDFWKRCQQNPQQKFVCVIDNFDKINPETFFGPELWEHMSSTKEAAVLGGKNIDIPKYFYMFSVAHLGPGSRVEFNEEHYKRLGQQYENPPDACELLDYFDQYRKETLREFKGDSSEKRAELSALVSTANRRRMVFYFLKANAMMRKRYGPGYELGQGSNVRKSYRPERLFDLKNTYITHINSLGRGKPLQNSDFDDLDYTVSTLGLEPHTNFFDRQITWLNDTGYLVEITMVTATALLTTLIGWWIFRRREKMIRNYGEKAQIIYNAFEEQQVSAEESSKELERIKNEVNDLVLQRKLNYNEGLYFMAFVDDKVRRIDFARNVSENFLELFNAFMEDDVLTENEYLKLCQFLQSMKHKIPEETYQTFIEKVESVYRS